MATANDLLTRAIDETKHLNHNEIFLVRDLFKGYEWNRISRSDRLLLGTLFLNYVHTTGTYIEPIEKTSSRQQKPKLRGFNSPSERTNRNRNNRAHHGEYLKRRSSELSQFWKE